MARFTVYARIETSFAYISKIFIVGNRKKMLPKYCNFCVYLTKLRLNYLNI